jgi:hypothetical protein
VVREIPPVRLVSRLRAALKYTPNLENRLSLIRKASTVKEVPSSLQVFAAEVENSSLILKPLEQIRVDAADIARGESRVAGCRGGCPAPVCE